MIVAETPLLGGRRRKRLDDPGRGQDARAGRGASSRRGPRARPRQRASELRPRILADLGADVILVEPPGGGALRRLGPFLDDEPGSERGYQHLYLNANKRSVALDVTDDTTPVRESRRRIAS